MPAEALIQLLSGIPAENIERIELITTPPAKYDAEGNAGYINIVLVSNPYTGLSGSWFLTAGYGKKETGAAGINFNYRAGRVNLYGSYTFNHDTYIQPGRGFTRFPKSGDIITNTSFTDRDAHRQVHNIRIGIDYQLDSSNIIGALVSGYYNHWKMIAYNGATISKNNIVDTIITTVNNPEMNLWKNVMANLNFQHTFKPGKLLFFDLNYIYYKDDNPNNYFTEYFNGAKEFLFSEISRSGKITPINFKVISSDYTTPIGKKMSMDAGLKLSLSRFTNDISADHLKQGVWVRDNNFSANYLLKENIAAAYTSLNIKAGSKTTITAGLRYEYTVSNLGTEKTANIVDRKYGELFPTFSISNKIDADNAINFSYGRRITRPTFNDLAPFTVFFDPKTFFSGDPSLQPAIANSLQAGYVFKNYNFTLSYTYEVSTIDNFYFQTQRIDTVSNLLYLSSRNFKNSQYMTASFSLPVTINKWWSMQNNIIGNWREINTAHDTRPVLLQNFDYSINSTQRFIISKDISAELTGFYSS
jgi:outer membrane receptor protein involved in Fe transport